MTRRPQLELGLFSRTPFDEGSIEKQLTWLTRFAEGQFCPERCDVYEPLREDFLPSDLSEPIKWLGHPGGEFKFKRKKRFEVSGVLRNRRFGQIYIGSGSARRLLVPTVPEPKITSTWTVWIGRRNGPNVDMLERFFSEVCEVAEADFGYLTTEEDHKSKNFLIRPFDGGVSESFVGDDIEKGIPGLYWLNFFGPIYVQWLGKDHFDQVNATAKRGHLNGGISLKFGEIPEDAQSLDVLAMQQAAKRILGESAFFDIRKIDAVLRTPEFR